jgi:hypothetical protein
MPIFSKARYLFNKLTLARDKRVIPSANFTKCWKLCKLAKVPIGKLLAFDFDHVYKQSLRFSQTNQMDYFAFLKGLELLADKFRLAGDRIDKFNQILNIIQSIV